MTDERRAPVQSNKWETNGGPCRQTEADGLVGEGTIAWSEHVEAWTAYAALPGCSGQSAERLAERGGFGYQELCGYLGRKPTTWQPRQPRR